MAFHSVWSRASAPPSANRSRPASDTWAAKTPTFAAKSALVIGAPRRPRSSSSRASLPADDGDLLFALFAPETSVSVASATPKFYASRGPDARTKAPFFIEKERFWFEGMFERGRGFPLVPRAFVKELGSIAVPLAGVHSR
jgi:hypothetical protein